MLHMTQIMQDISDDFNTTIEGSIFCNVIANHFFTEEIEKILFAQLRPIKKIGSPKL